MPRAKTVLAVALSLLLLGACRGSEPAATGNLAADTGSSGLENAQQPDLAQPGGSDAPSESAPPPDAVSHPDGYLPEPAPATPEAPATADPPESSDRQPATEDEYIRNGQGSR